MQTFAGLDASRSWHGTSTQLIQPLTVSGDLSQEDVCTQNELSHIPRSYSQATSPINSPMPINKSKRQRRTLTEQPSPHTTISLLPYQTEGECSQFPTMQRTEYTQSHGKLTISMFRPEDVEKASLDIVQQDLFKCVCLRALAGENILPGLVSLLNCVSIGGNEKELSRVVYAEIVSERADSKPTLLGIISRLQQVFLSELEQKYDIM